MAIGAQQARFLARLRHCKNPSARKKLLEEGGPGLQKVLREIAHNLLRGNVTLTASQLGRLKRHKNALRALARKKTPLKRNLYEQQRGGFLPALITPVLASIASGVISSLVKR